MNVLGEIESMGIGCNNQTPNTSFTTRDDLAASATRLSARNAWSEL